MTVAELERPAAAAISFTVDRDAMLGAIRAINRVIEARNTIPILSNLLLTAGTEGLRVCGTDMDIQFDVTVPCDADGSVSLTVEASKLIASIDTMRPGKLVFEVEDSWVHLKNGRAHRKLPTLPADNFPQMEIRHGDETVRFAIDTSKFIWLLDSVKACMSSDDKTRYYCCGINLAATGGDIVAAALDGSRMAQAILPAPAGASALPSIIVAAKNVRLLLDMLRDGEPGSQAEVLVSKGKIDVRVGRFRMIGKLIDATFPDYRRALPQPQDSILQVQAGEFARCVKAALALTDGKTRGVRLELEGEDSIVSGRAADGSRAVEPIDGAFSGDTFSVGVNARYALEAAAAFGEAAALEIEFAVPTHGTASSILFRCPDKPGLLVLAMSMNA